MHGVAFDDGAITVGPDGDGEGGFGGESDEDKSFGHGVLRSPVRHRTVMVRSCTGETVAVARRSRKVSALLRSGRTCVLL